MSTSPAGQGAEPRSVTIGSSGEQWNSPSDCRQTRESGTWRQPRSAYNGTRSGVHCRSPNGGLSGTCDGAA